LPSYFQTNLKMLLIKSGIKQTHLSDSLSVSRETISGWVNGRYIPYNNSLKRLSNFFNDVLKNRYSLTPERLIGIDLDAEQVEMVRLGMVPGEWRMTEKPVGVYNRVAEPEPAAEGMMPGGLRELLDDLKLTEMLVITRAEIDILRTIIPGKEFYIEALYKLRKGRVEA
jgi:transcriptional regulator with XRE-family HTH domain